MSIATLKRKTLAKYNNSSVNSKNGFSLNGTHRNQGYVGQTSLSRSLPRTLMKGNTIRGHGGCCGTYRMSPIIQSGVSSTEDSSVVKSSVMSTKGLIASRFRYKPYNVVKPDSNQHSNSQWNQIMRKKGCVTNSLINNESSTPASCMKCVNKSGHLKSADQVFTKPESDYLSIPYNDYIERIKACATKNDIKYVPVSIRQEPIP